MKDNISVLVIYTGGTIGMIQDKDSGALHPFNFDQLYKQIPVLEYFDFSIDCHSFDPLVDSSDMNPEIWIKLADVIEANYEDYDGFVILHGSDTMAYSASALSFMLENLNKPVIFTGSQLPLGIVRSDGRENFITSIEIAAARIDDTAIVPEVCIYFENNLYRGNRTFKNNAEHFQAFQSLNYPPLAEVGVHIKYNYNHILKPKFKRLKVFRDLNSNIGILKLFPGIRENFVRSIVESPGLEGLILETYGSGNAPTAEWLIDLLKECIHEKNILVYNVTQCKGGAVDMGKYQTSVALSKIGVKSGRDITTESALAKMMYVLGKYKDREEAGIMLERSLKGEMRAKND